MTKVKVSPKVPRSQLTHDVAIMDDTQTVGLRFAQSPLNFTRVPMMESDRLFAETQTDWFSGMGRKKFRDDPSGFRDSRDMWATTPHKVFAAPAWKFPTGFRSADSAMHGSVSWQPLFGTQLAIATSFVANSSTAADKAMLNIRRKGTPGTLTFILAGDTAGSPGTVLQTVTKTVSDITDYLSVYEIFDWASTNARSSGTTYWIYVYGATTDNNSNHWLVACNASGSGKQSASGTSPSWSALAYSLYYRVVDADTARRLYFFRLEGAQYCMSRNDDGATAPKLWIIGDRGRLSATSAVGATTVTDSSEGVTGAWATDELAGRRIMFINNTGSNQRTYSITANNTSGAMTISPALEAQVDNTTDYVIYADTKFREITNHGFTVNPTCRPVSGSNTCFVMHGTSVAADTFRYNATQAQRHQYSSIALMKYDLATVHGERSLGIKLWAAEAAECTLRHATIPTWGGSWTTTGTVKGNTVGSTDFNITSLVSTGKRLMVGKEQALHEIEEATAKEYTLPIKDVPSMTNGLAISAPDSDTVYYGYGDSVGKMTGTQHTDLMNYRTGYDGLPADRRGYCSAIVNVMGWTFFAFDGGQSNYSSVFVYNQMGQIEFFRAWKAGLRIRDLWFEPCPDTNGKLWIDVGGEPVYISLPYSTSNPLKDSGMTFRPEFFWETGAYDIEKFDRYKLFSELVIASENLSAGTRYAEIDYALDTNEETTPTWIHWTTYSTSPKQREMLNIGEAHNIRLRFRVYSTSETTPAQITMTDLRGEMAEPARDMWIGDFVVGGKTYQNEDDHDPTWLVEWFQDAHRKKKKLRMLAARELDNDKYVTVQRPSDRVATINKGEWTGRITLQFREVAEQDAGDI